MTFDYTSDVYSVKDIFYYFVLTNVKKKTT